MGSPAVGLPPRALWEPLKAGRALSMIPGDGPRSRAGMAKREPANLGKPRDATLTHLRRRRPLRRASYRAEGMDMQTNTAAGRWGAVVLFLTLAVTLGFLALANASPVEAAKGGQGKSQGGGHGQDGTTDTDTGGGGRSGGSGGGPQLVVTLMGGEGVIASSTSIRAGGDAYMVSGSGFAANSPVFLSYHEPFCCAATTVWTDGSGSFST